VLSFEDILNKCLRFAEKLQRQDPFDEYRAFRCSLLVFGSGCFSVVCRNKLGKHELGAGRGYYVCSPSLYATVTRAMILRRWTRAVAVYKRSLITELTRSRASDVYRRMLSTNSSTGKNSIAERTKMTDKPQLCPFMRVNRVAGLPPFANEGAWNIQVWVHIHKTGTLCRRRGI
jgi:hypothetical protein